jgi:hypothetical protein
MNGTTATGKKQKGVSFPAVRKQIGISNVRKAFQLLDLNWKWLSAAQVSGLAACRMLLRKYVVALMKIRLQNDSIKLSWLLFVCKLIANGKGLQALALTTL